MSNPLTSRSAAEPSAGGGAFRYRALVTWEQLPPGWSFGEAIGVATDSADNVYVFNRGEHPLIVFDRRGKFLRSWGEGGFARPHGITIGPDDAVYLVDDLGHVVRKFTTEGRLLTTLGTPGVASDTGAVGLDYRTIRRAAGPFNCPTNVALSAGGDLYIADGYGNARVHHFSPAGKLLNSWGEPGNVPGQFHVPHGIAVDRDGTVLVADRENSRLERFAPDGRLIAVWTDVARPCEVTVDPSGNIFVAELGYRAGMFPGNVAEPGQTTGGRVSIFNSRGELQATIGGGDHPCSPGDFFAPHDITIDHFGDFYVGEVTLSAGGNEGLVPPDCHTLQKFVRITDQEPS
jgi:DNA-binding beta-propeller fold protein YncE